MASPTDVLRDEHRVILRALDVLDGAAGRVMGGAALPEGWWDDLIGWLRAFADRNHHAKEEKSLFPAMAKAGVPCEGGPIGVMLEEHEQGRALIQRMAAGEPAQRATAARQYGQLLRDHIDKENGILFPLADAVLDEQAQRALEREFEVVETEQGMLALTGRAESAVERLAAALG